MSYTDSKYTVLENPSENFDSDYITDLINAFRVVGDDSAIWFPFDELHMNPRMRGEPSIANNTNLVFFNGSFKRSYLDENSNNVDPEAVTDEMKYNSISERVATICHEIPLQDFTIMLAFHHSGHFSSYIARVSDGRCELLSVNYLGGYKDKEIIQAVKKGIKQGRNIEESQFDEPQFVIERQNDAHSCGPLTAAIAAYLDPQKKLSEQVPLFRDVIKRFLKNKKGVRQLFAKIIYAMEDLKLDEKRVLEKRTSWWEQFKNELGFFTEIQNELYKAFQDTNADLPLADRFFSAVKQCPAATKHDRRVIALKIVKEQFNSQESIKANHFQIALILSFVGIILPLISHIIIWSTYLHMHRHDIVRLSVKASLFSKFKKAKKEISDDFDLDAMLKEDKDPLKTRAGRTSFSTLYDPVAPDELEVYCVEPEKAYDIQKGVKKAAAAA